MAGPEKETPQGETHQVTEALGAQRYEDIVKGPPATDHDRFVSVGTADDPFEADLLTDAVDEAGISVIARARRDAILDPLVVPAPAWWDILVPREHEAKARELVAARQAIIERDAPAASLAAEEEEAGTEKVTR